MQDGKKILQQILAGMKVHSVAELHSREVALQVLAVCTRFCAHMLRKMQPKPPSLCCSFLKAAHLLIISHSLYRDAHAAP